MAKLGAVQRAQRVVGVTWVAELDEAKAARPPAGDTSFEE